MEWSVHHAVTYCQANFAQAFYKCVGYWLYTRNLETSKTVLIDKEKGDRSDITSFRPVGLTITLHKL